MTGWIRKGAPQHPQCHFSSCSNICFTLDLQVPVLAPGVAMTEHFHDPFGALAQVRQAILCIPDSQFQIQLSCIGGQCVIVYGRFSAKIPDRRPLIGITFLPDSATVHPILSGISTNSLRRISAHLLMKSASLIVSSPHRCFSSPFPPNTRNRP